MTTAYRLAHELALTRHPDPFRPARSDNRWNSRDTQVAYAAESLALAALELLTYWGNYPNLRGYQLFSIAFEEKDSEDLLEHRFDLDPTDYSQTRSYGDLWVEEGRSLALKVPSVVVPLSSNYLINPSHPRFTTSTVTSHGRFIYDKRIAQLFERAKAAE
ncbi:RES family NAD+ phosphorylase [soil metagenome]